MAWENLQQFEALEETGKNTLSGQEKTQLNQVSERDYRKAVSKVEIKTFKIDWFKVDGKDPTLKQIVENLTFSSDWKTAYLNWKAIEPTSELWAAIQVLVIASDFSVWWDKIDGSVWKNTIDGLQKLKNKYRAKRANETETPTETVDDKILDNLNVLKTANMYQYFWDDAKKYQDTYNILDKNTWVIKGLYINPTSWMVSFSYKSQYKAQQGISIDPDVFLNDNKTVNISKFVKEVKDRISKNETKLYNEQRNAYLIEWIKNFKPNDFTDKVVNTYMQDKKIKFTVEVSPNDQSKLIVKDSLWWSKTVSASMYNLVSEKKFDKNQFRIDFTNYYKSKAEEHCQDKITNSIAAIDRIRVSDWTSATKKVGQYSELLNTVTSYKNSKFDTQKTEISEKKFLAEMDETKMALEEFLYKWNKSRSHTSEEFRNARNEYTAKIATYREWSKNLWQKSMQLYNTKIKDLDWLLNKLP